jgi:hypothetical protein
MKGGYQLSREALRKINTPAMRRKLMDILHVTEFTIARYIQKNKSRLTEYAVLELIIQEIGLTIEQILKEG